VRALPIQPTVVVDPVGLEAAKKLVENLLTATRPMTLGNDPGGPAQHVPNVDQIRRDARRLRDRLM
jgi:hypothetical protein